MNYTDTEIWMDIEGLEGEYQISSHARVRSLDRAVAKRNGVVLPIRGKILRQVTGDGYCRVRLKGVASVHRLVAKHFIPNPQNLSQVDHIDNDTMNNHVKNLRWSSGSDNMKNSWKYRNRKMSKHEAPTFIDGEIWKKIEGVNQPFYQVSNLGRVRALAHTTFSTDNKTYNIPEKLIRQHKGRADYDRVTLSKKSFRVHILVAQAFLPNPNNLEQVDHIDGDKNNNSVVNLRWVSREENMNYAVKNGLRKLGGDCWQARRIRQRSMNDDVIANWPCITDAAKKLLADGCGKNLLANISNIRGVLIGRTTHSFGSKWEYVAE